MADEKKAKQRKWNKTNETKAASQIAKRLGYPPKIAKVLRMKKQNAWIILVKEGGGEILYIWYDSQEEVEPVGTPPDEIL